MPASTRMPSMRASSARMRAAWASARAFVEPVGHRQRLAVIGDRDVFEAGVARREHHRLEVVLAVGLGRVHVQVAAQVAERR